MTPQSLSAISLIGVNLIPLAGVLFFGWDVASIMLLYWSENVVIGLFNVLRMIKAEGKSGKSGSQGKAGTVFFFIIHYGMFTFVHGMFVASLFGLPEKNFLGLGVAVVGLFFSHGVSYRRNFILPEEFKKITYDELFMQPYKRVIVMHLTIILGGGVAGVTGATSIALVVLVSLKIGIDLFSHRKEHNKWRKKLG